METIQDLLSFENPVFRGYLYYSSILVLKMMAMSPYTILNRFIYKSFMNPEDSALIKAKPKTHENVKRIKRAHLNDLENIPMFFTCAFAYILINPDPSTAMTLFGIFTGARITHTIIYTVYVVPQPGRAIMWRVANGVTAYMIYKKMELQATLSLENPVFKAYIYYCAILVIKMMAMSPLTSVQRIKHKAFANPEDAALQNVKPKVHDSVERVRRGHLNDMENIPIFFVASFCYIMTNPTPWLALALFKIFTIARVIHTLVYTVVVIRQPARAVSWGIGYAITGYMAVASALHFCCN